MVCLECWTFEICRFLEEWFVEVAIYFEVLTDPFDFSRIFLGLPKYSFRDSAALNIIQLQFCS
jgi:hypothetical protein